MAARVQGGFTCRTARREGSTDSAAEEVQGVQAGDLADGRVVVPAGDQAADDVEAVGGRLQALEVRRRQRIGCLTTLQYTMEAVRVTHLATGADPDVSC